MEEQPVSEGFFIESAATGRFRRYRTSEAGTWRIPAVSKSKSPSGTDNGEALVRLAFIGFLFLQGLLSGLSLSALYEAFSDRAPGEFLRQYAHRANEMRRYFFIGVTYSVTGSLCLLGGDEKMLSSMKRGKPSSRAQSHNVLLVLVYFTALVLTMLCSRLDVRITYLAMHMEDSDMLSNADQDVVHHWKGLCVPRSLLCIAGWLVSCYRFVVMRSHVKHDE